MNSPSQIFLTILITITEPLYWSKTICGCFCLIWLWLLIAIMKWSAERCALQLHRASLKIIACKVSPSSKSESLAYSQNSKIGMFYLQIVTEENWCLGRQILSNFKFLVRSSSQGCFACKRYLTGQKCFSNQAIFNPLMSGGSKQGHTYLI